LALPVSLPPRGLSIEDACEYLGGISKNTLTRHGPPPTRIGDRIVYDRLVLDRWLDELAGLGDDATGEISSEDALLKAIHARQAPLRRTSR
jgi:hypothetical protein